MFNLLGPIEGARVLVSDGHELRPSQRSRKRNRKHEFPNRRRRAGDPRAEEVVDDSGEWQTGT